MDLPQPYNSESRNGPEITYVGDHPDLGVRAVGFDTNHSFMAGISPEEVRELCKELAVDVHNAERNVSSVHERRSKKKKISESKVYPVGEIDNPITNKRRTGNPPRFDIVFERDGQTIRLHQSQNNKTVVWAITVEPDIFKDLKKSFRADQVHSKEDLIAKHNVVTELLKGTFGPKTKEAWTPGKTEYINPEDRPDFIDDEDEIDFNF